VGDLVPIALAALDRGGTVAVAGIHLSDIPGLDYQRHLFRERTLTRVTANTRADGEDMPRLVHRHGVRATVSAYPFERADAALDELAHDRVRGAAVLRVGEGY
jgi:propanol-preferring alcohol dehydrogenase